MTHFNAQMDYAILVNISNGTDLVPIPISITPPEPDQDLKVFHCPVSLFNDGIVNSLSFFSLWLKASRPSKHHVMCHGGLSQGSSGAPFVTKSGEVIGMQVESVNGVIDSPSIADLDIPAAVELISESVVSLINNHASYCQALLFGRCPNLLNNFCLCCAVMLCNVLRCLSSFSLILQQPNFPHRYIHTRTHA